jgi:SAM-dependent methyltransferase
MKMKNKNIYNKKFYESQAPGSLSSARIIVPFLNKLTGCTSVLDVGCGVGTWLSAFREHGVTDLRGLDGDYIDQNQLLIPEEEFRSQDLKRPFDLGRRFDLLISLEVAEHLPSEVAEQFVESLIKHAPVIAFSASVPGQVGIGHLNEKWQEYWVEIFAKRGYKAIDCIRPTFWDNEGVDWWYLQNMILYVQEENVGKLPFIAPYLSDHPSAKSIVHPKFFTEKMNELHSAPRLRNQWTKLISHTFKKYVS